MKKVFAANIDPDALGVLTGPHAERLREAPVA
jgi:hypothetical protein